jgi:hypothetical protein
LDIEDDVDDAKELMGRNAGVGDAMKFESCNANASFPRTYASRE